MFGSILILASLVALAIHIVAFAVNDGPTIVVPRMISVALFVGMPALYGAGLMLNSQAAQVVGAVVAFVCLGVLVTSKRRNTTQQVE